MLANFFHDERMMNEFAVSFSYRQSEAYDTGFRKRVKRHFDVRPLRLRDVSALRTASEKLPSPIGWLVRALAQLLLVRYWFVVWNTWVLYKAFGKFGKIDLLHVNNGNYPGAYSCMSAVFAGRLRGVKHIVYVVNNIAIPYSAPRRWLDFPFDRIVADTVSVFITASRHAGIALGGVLRLPRNKIRNLHNGIAPRIADETREQLLLRLDLPANRLLVGVVAVLDPRKGHMVLLEALLRLKRANQDHLIPFIIIEGSGEMWQAIADFVEKNSLAGDVRLVGNESNIFSFMNAMDVIALPSVSHEDFPNVVLEAMSLGKAVIATRLAGIPEQIEHLESGILVEPGDVGGLADALQIAAEDPALLARIGNAAQRRFTEQFTAVAAVSGYLSLYRNLMHEKEGKSG